MARSILDGLKITSVDVAESWKASRTFPSEDSRGLDGFAEDSFEDDFLKVTSLKSFPRLEPALMDHFPTILDLTACRRG